MYGDKSWGVAVAELNDPEACYDFHDVVVWRKADGSFVWASDAGCSCPTPFEDTTEADLTPVSLRDDEWDRFLNYLDKDWCYGTEEGSRRAALNTFVTEVRTVLS